MIFGFIWIILALHSINETDKNYHHCHTQFEWKLITSHWFLYSRFERKIVIGVLRTRVNAKFMSVSTIQYYPILYYREFDNFKCKKYSSISSECLISADKVTKKLFIFFSWKNSWNQFLFFIYVYHLVTEKISNYQTINNSYCFVWYVFAVQTI